MVFVGNLETLKKVIEKHGDIKIIDLIKMNK